MVFDCLLQHQEKENPCDNLSTKSCSDTFRGNHTGGTERKVTYVIVVLKLSGGMPWPSGSLRVKRTTR